MRGHSSTVILASPNVTVRGAPLTKAKRSRRTLIKTELQNRHRAARPFDRLVGLTIRRCFPIHERKQVITEII